MNIVVRLGILLILRDKKCAKIQLKAQIKCKLAEINYEMQTDGKERVNIKRYSTN